jgi:hypothetical protein
MEVYGSGDSFLNKAKLYTPKLASAVKEGIIEGVKQGVKQGVFSAINPKGKSAYLSTNSIANLAHAYGNIDELINTNIKSRSSSPTPFLNSFGVTRMGKQSPTQLQMTPIRSPVVYPTVIRQIQKMQSIPKPNFKPITPVVSPRRNRTNSNASTILLNSPIELLNNYQNNNQAITRSITPNYDDIKKILKYQKQENNTSKSSKLLIGGKTRKMRKYKKNTRKVRRTVLC